MDAQAQPQVPTLSPQQVQEAAGAGIGFFNMKSTLIPGDIRRQIAVLEAVLQGIATGNLQVVSPQPVQVESVLDEGDISDLTQDDDNGSSEQTET